MLKRNYVLFSHLFIELEQSYVSLIMSRRCATYPGIVMEAHSVSRMVTLVIHSSTTI